MSPTALTRFGTHEAHQFTPWLQEHIDQLNEAIGFEIELSEREERVGPFAVDLYGKEVQAGHPAIIGNQLEPTDHGHLGQLLTYAAGLKAGIIVWIGWGAWEDDRRWAPRLTMRARRRGARGPGARRLRVRLRFVSVLTRQY